MQISVSGKQLDVGAALKEYVESELTERVNKYFEDAISADVVFTKERHLFCVDILVNEGTGTNVLIKSQAKADEPHSAFDLAAEKVDKQLRRYKRRLKDHHKRKVSQALDLEHMAATKYVLSSREEDDDKAGEENDSPLIIAEKSTKIERLTVSDAVMLMDLANLPALMFINQKTEAINVVYRRVDGNISWIDSNSVLQRQKNAA